MVRQVKFTEWTRDERLRQPVFLGGQRGTGQIREKVQQDENGGVRSSFNDVEGPDHGLVNLVVGTKLQRPQQGGVTRL